MFKRQRFGVTVGLVLLVSASGSCLSTGDVQKIEEKERKKKERERMKNSTARRLNGIGAVMESRCCDYEG